MIYSNICEIYNNNPRHMMYIKKIFVININHTHSRHFANSYHFLISIEGVLTQSR